MDSKINRYFFKLCSDLFFLFLSLGKEWKFYLEKDFSNLSEFVFIFWDHMEQIKF